MKWKRIAKIFLWLVKWSFIIWIILAIEEQIENLEKKVDVYRVLVKSPPTSTNVKDVYMFYSMEHFSTRKGYPVYIPVYVRLVDVQNSALNRQLDYYKKEKQGARYDSSNIT